MESEERDVGVDEDVVIDEEVDVDVDENENENEMEMEMENEMVVDDEMDEMDEMDLLEKGGELEMNSSTTTSLAQVIKKPYTAYFIFMLEMREKLQKEKKVTNFREMPKLLGELYRELSVEEKQRLEDLAKIEKKKYDEAVAEQIRVYGKVILAESQVKQGDSLILPMSRIRKTMKMDKDVKNVSKEALMAITKATEFFLGFLTQRTRQVLDKRKGKIIKDVDMFSAVHSFPPLHFLRLDFPKKLLVNANQSTTKSEAAKKEAKKALAITPSAGIASFFSKSAPSKVSIEPTLQRNKDSNEKLDT